MKRRQFFGALGILASGSFIAKPDFAAAKVPSVEEALASALDDETFWKIVRQQFVFPKDFIYLNTGGIGAVPSLVLHEVSRSTDEQQLSPKPGHDEMNWNNVKITTTHLLSPNCKKEELALISTATEGINIILNGLPLQKKDEIITSTHEHAALHIPLLNKMQRQGIVLKPFAPDLKNGLGNVDRIAKLITKRTKLIFLSHVTCTTGQIFPLIEIGNLARAKGIWFAVDGAQAVGSMPMDITKAQVDFYTFSGHKWTLGPKRTGVLYVRQNLLEVLRPTTVGAYSDDGYDILKNELKLHPTAQRYEYATQNEALFYGYEKAVNFVKTIGLEKIRQHNRTLAEKFYAGLLSIPGVEILSPQEEKYRSSIISFKMKDKNYQDIGSYLSDKKKIRVRVVSEAQVNGVRVSFHVYNDEENVERILTELNNFLKQ